jgi:hypothetical protein
MQFQILNEQGDVVNTVVADEVFMEAAYPGRFRPDPNWSPPPEPTMPELRQAAFGRAMEFGKRIEQAILGRYTAGEPLTWETQEREARLVLSGATLGPDAILPGLAEDRGITLASLAAIVVAKADQFKLVVRAGQRLRRAAEGLLSPSLDTPAALDAAVQSLRQAAAQEATALGLPLPQ